MEKLMDIQEKQNLYKQYLSSVNQVFDAWFTVKGLYSKLANAYNVMCKKFFDTPVLKESGHTLRYCIIKQYKPVMADVLVKLNAGFPAGQEFSEPLFFERRFCEYYTPDKMCIVDGCSYYPFNKEYFDLLQKFQDSLKNYQNVMSQRQNLFNQMLATKGYQRRLLNEYQTEIKTEIFTIPQISLCR